jgi:D,D-heptose 1,7-bisphosphate phosphatase
VNNPAVFLDRDGTLIVEKNYLSDPEEIEFIHGSIDALKALQQAGFLLIIVTNQSGVARGMFNMSAVNDVNRVLDELLVDAGVPLDGIYVCPHHPDFSGLCACRKPLPGMLNNAIRDLMVDDRRSYMIGDKGSDIGAGLAVGMASILVRTGYGDAGAETPTYVADDLPAAAEWILSRV